MEKGQDDPLEEGRSRGKGPGRAVSWKNTCLGPGRPLRTYPFKPSQPKNLSPMSQHKSLQGANGIVRKRNVLKRFERLDLLKKRGQWKTGDRVVGLRKTKPDI
jgi:small basic protein (TIGR04137 family)